ncbi:hypothetical protein [Cyanothece sp. BG0011]|uniref:hypothetical protein n=1 Tax=Cyanothece sp. BG0011 TaxID=2082950 RepID=UPI000D1D8054|nr:hypothetical protein [Cyanothece sp. BG0011]
MLNTPMDNVTVEQKIKDIAYLAGTSQEMIFKHYQGMSKYLYIPEIDILLLLNKMLLYYLYY